MNLNLFDTYLPAEDPVFEWRIAPKEILNKLGESNKCILIKQYTHPAELRQFCRQHPCFKVQVRRGPYTSTDYIFYENSIVVRNGKDIDHRPHQWTLPSLTLMKTIALDTYSIDQITSYSIHHKESVRRIDYLTRYYMIPIPEEEVLQQLQRIQELELQFIKDHLKRISKPR